MRVLFVDDDAALSQGVEMALREQGHACELADLGKQAVSLSKRNQYDIVVLDVGLPDIDGCHVARLMKMDGVKTPVLLHSGLADPTLPDEAEELGVNGFLAKPFSIAELVEHMEAVLAGRGFVGPRDIAPPEPAPPPATPAEPVSQREADTEVPEPHRPTAVAKARAALRAQPEEPTRLEAMTKTGAGVLSKAAATARGAMTSTVEAGARLLPESAEGSEGSSGPSLAGAAKTLSGVMAKARGALGGEAFSKARDAIGAEKVSKTVGRVRHALADRLAAGPGAREAPPDASGAGREAAPAPRRGRMAAIQGKARTLAGSAARAQAVLRGRRRDDSAPEPGTEEEIKAPPPAAEPAARAAEPVPLEPGDAAREPRTEIPSEGAPDGPANTTPGRVRPDTDAPPQEPRPAGAGMPTGPSADPQAEREAEPAPEQPPAAQPGPGAETSLETASAAADREPPQDARQHGAEPGVTPDPPRAPSDERGTEPAPLVPPTGLSGPNPIAEGEIEPARPEPRQDAPRTTVQPDPAPVRTAEPHGETETEPHGDPETEPAPEPPPAAPAEPVPEAADQIEAVRPVPDPPQPATQPGVPPEQTPEPQADPRAEPAPELPPAGPAEPAPETADQIEAARPVPDPAQEPPQPAAQPDVAPVPTAEPEAMDESEASIDDVLDTLFGPAGDGDAAEDTPGGEDTGHQADQGPPPVEAAVIMDGETRHACIVVERTENGAVLRLGHPERELSEILTLQILDGPELRCAQSWRKDDRIGIEFF